MPRNYTQEQLLELYQNLPEDLKEAVFSEKTAQNIQDICTRSGVTERKTPEKVAKYTGYVLLGVLPPNEFQETLEKEVKLEKEVAKKVSQEINRFIFYPMESSLEKLYKIEITPPPKPPERSPAVSPPEVSPPETAPLSEEEKPPSKKPDVYREPLE